MKLQLRHCAAVLALTVLGSLPALGEKPAAGTAEEAWKAKPAQARERQRGGGQRLGAEQGDPMAEGPGPHGPRQMEDGPPGGPPEEAGPGRRVFRRFVEMREESRRLKMGETELKRLEDRVTDMKEKGEVTPDREQRIRRIVELKRELLGLERQEYTARVKSETDKLIQLAEKKKSELPEDAPPPQIEMFERVQSNIKKINESATDFETLTKALDDVASELPPMMEGGNRRERFQRELDVLQKRMDHIRQEYGEFGDEGPGPMDGRPERRPPPGINPEDEGMYPGLNGPPPGAIRDEGGAGAKRKAKDGQRNDSKQ